MTVAIIDYGSGNLRSAAKAFERSIRESGRSDPVRVTNSAEEAAAADRIVLPGVGAFADCRSGLDSLDGMVEALEEAIIIRGKPFLGICVGMQLMATRGLEHGEHPGFGWIEGDVTPIDMRSPAERNGSTLKIPHMGWNDIVLDRADHPVFAGLQDGSHAYFVHSFHMVCRRPEDQLAHVEYGGPVVAAVGRDNIVGTQFHPEKSQAVGLQIIGNFLSWQP
jgi:glutamine amidotransferase